MKSKILLALGKEGLYTYENGCHIWKLPNGKFHRFEGPALSGKGRSEYFINGMKYLPEDFWNKMKDTKHSKRIMANILGSKKSNV